MSTAPDLQSPFMEFLLEHNRPRMNGFKQWVFQPGMRFQALQKWWGDQGRRAAPHEGLDLYSFKDGGGTIKTVDQYTQIPAAFAGHIVKIQPDFLGKSIFMSHAGIMYGERRLLSAFGHTVPRTSLQTGQSIAQGEVIATVSGFPGKATDLLPHLHLTFAWVPADFSPDRLTWKNLGNDPGIRLIDPLTVISRLAG
jgi:murein DD-endopeptidase MepM/ murein hydrolase activator NlpD